MRLAHLADVHLGFRQFHKLSRRGVNQREADVSDAFRRTVDDVIACAPDIVVIAGDLFNAVRPSNGVIVHCFRQLKRLHEALPDAPILIVAGNHDTPRSVETGTVLTLYREVENVQVVDIAPREIVFDGLDLAVTCVPHPLRGGGEWPSMIPASDTRWKVAVAHWEVKGVLPRDAACSEDGATAVEPADLNADRWDYIALGHYHVAHRVYDNAWYAGALEYVSHNPWGELRDEAREGREGQKGWLLVDLAQGPSVEFRPIPLARRFLDLEPIHASGLTAAEIDALVAERVAAAPGSVDDCVVRQVVHDVPRPTARDLDHGVIRELKVRALHYHLDLRRPRSTRTIGVGAPGVRQTLTDVVADYLSRRPLDAGVSRDALTALGRRYMEEIERAGAEGT
jgi:exonuclease SbcD